MTGADRKLSRCKATLAVGLCAALLGQVAPLGAQSDDENARRHFESGAAYLQQSDNDNALREFQAAYSLSKRPALLLNIANVYERMGKPKEAVEALTKYLAEDPKATDRTTQETRIANLKKRIESGDSTPPPAASASTPPVQSAAPPPSSSPPPPLLAEAPKPARCQGPIASFEHSDHRARLLVRARHERPQERRSRGNWSNGDRWSSWLVRYRRRGRRSRVFFSRS